MSNVVCPGSFDPVTNGHLDIFGRAARLFDSLTVAVLVNESKSGLFSMEDRLEMLTEETARFGNVKVASFDGLLVDFCFEHDITAILKGLRGASDFDYELQMAQMNNHLTDVDTLFMPTSPGTSFLSSSLIKEVARNGGDVSALVPASVLVRLKDRLAI